jgi:hypothetical protein
MKYFSVHNFIHAIELLERVECIGRQQQSVDTKEGPRIVIFNREDPLTEIFEKSYSSSLAFIRTKCELLDLEAAIVRCEHFAQYLRGASGTPTIGGSSDQAKVLRETIEGELRFRRFAFVTKEKGKILDAVRHDWSTVLSQFPTADNDIMEAIRCYALERNTACIFHLMRVAEFGMRSLARERKVKLPKNKMVEWAQWQEIIKALADSADAIFQQWKAGPVKDRALGFYRGAIAELTGFKDEYRNHVMHSRTSYNEAEAASVMIKVREFMCRLSLVLNENPKHPIRWGRK